MNSEEKKNETLQTPGQIRHMFNRIAPTYDLLNHLLSFGLDIRWRKKAATILKEKTGGVILDIAAGSGDSSLEMLKIQPRLVVASDFAHNMLEEFRKKIDNRGGVDSIKLVSCDALSLPFCDASFDATIVAFGIRNFAQKVASLKEMMRVLKYNGIAVILELSKPTGLFIAPLYTLYAQWGLPLLGRIISRHNSAYRYLPDSISNFPEREEFLGMMKNAGFENSEAYLLTFGAATLFVGKKSAPV